MRRLAARAGWGVLALLFAAGGALAQSLPGLIVTVPPTAPAATPKPEPAPRAAAKPAVKPKPQAPQTPQAKSASLGAAGAAAKPGSGQSITMVVNGEPITAYEIDQRAHLLALNSNISERAQENMKRLAQSDSTNERWRQIVQETVAANQGKSRDQIGAIIEEKKKQFGQELQKQAIEGARSSVIPTLKKNALEELIEEQLKVQEAKRVGVSVDDADVETIIKGLADRNKMTSSQFVEHFRGMGVDIATLRGRYRAQMAWTEVIRRKFSFQVNITQRDIDQAVSGADGGVAQVELQLHRILIPIPAKLDQKSMAQRFVEADGLRRQFKGCQTTEGVAGQMAGARFENVGKRSSASIQEPTRSKLLSAKDGEMIPPDFTPQGIELLAVCGRTAVRPQEAQRDQKAAELRQKEFEILARRHLRDLRQDAVIEPR